MNIEIKKNHAYHAKTQDEANWILSIANEKGFKWCNGISFIEETKWEVYKSKTCYSIYGGEYTDRSYYEDNNYIIIEVADLMKGITFSNNNSLLTYAWCIKTDQSEYFKNTVLKWLNENIPNETSGHKWKGVSDKDCYYGVNERGKSFCSSNPKTTISKITMEDFLKYTNQNSKNMNSLPKYWYVKNKHSHYVNPIIEWAEELNINPEDLEGSSKNGLYGIGLHKNLIAKDNVSRFPDGAVELTLEEFKQLINNKQTTIKTNNYEQKHIEGRSIEICKPVATITGGTPIRGNSISGRTSKTAISVGHLSYSAITI